MEELNDSCDFTKEFFDDVVAKVKVLREYIVKTANPKQLLNIDFDIYNVKFMVGDVEELT